MSDHQRLFCPASRALQGQGNDGSHRPVQKQWPRISFTQLVSIKGCQGTYWPNKSAGRPLFLTAWEVQHPAATKPGPARGSGRMELFHLSAFTLVLNELIRRFAGSRPVCLLCASCDSCESSLFLDVWTVTHLFEVKIRLFFFYFIEEHHFSSGAALNVE